MPKGERRQGAVRPIPVLGRHRRETPWSDSRVIPAIVNDDKLAFAVRNATQSEESDSDAMLLKHIAEGDRAAMHIMFGESWAIGTRSSLVSNADAVRRASEERLFTHQPQPSRLRHGFLRRAVLSA